MLLVPLVLGAEIEISAGEDTGSGESAPKISFHDPSHSVRVELTSSASSELVCSGSFQATDLKIAGTDMTVSQLITKLLHIVKSFMCP